MGSSNRREQCMWPVPVQYVNSKAPGARSDVSFVLLGEAVPKERQSLSPTHPDLQKRDAGNALLNT